MWQGFLTHENFVSAGVNPTCTTLGVVAESSPTGYKNFQRKVKLLLYVKEDG